MDKLQFLPDLVLHEIFLKLNIRDLMNLLNVHRRFREIIFENRFLKLLYKRKDCENLFKFLNDHLNFLVNSKVSEYQNRINLEIVNNALFITKNLVKQPSILPNSWVLTHAGYQKILHVRDSVIIFEDNVGIGKKWKIVQHLFPIFFKCTIK